MDERIRELRRRLDEGDFTVAARYVAELERRGEDQLERFWAVVQRLGGALPAKGGRGSRLVTSQARRTLELGKRFGRAWGSSWKKAGTARGEKVVVACLCDRDLGFFAIAVHRGVVRARVPEIWPAWKRYGREFPPPETVRSMNLWALDPDAMDRAVFSLERAVSAVENFFT
jgi:hypothetical protein